MSDLKTAITCLEIAVAAMVLLVLGDYLGYKFGHMRTAIAIRNHYIDFNRGLRNLRSDPLFHRY